MRRFTPPPEPEPPPTPEPPAAETLTPPIAVDLIRSAPASPPPTSAARAGVVVDPDSMAPDDPGPGEPERPRRRILDLRRRLSAASSPGERDGPCPPSSSSAPGTPACRRRPACAKTGYDGAIVLLSDESELPYQRPPLSKAFLKREMELHGLPLRAEAFYRDQRIDLRRGVRATRIDRVGRRVEIADGPSIGYGHLILATGARQRRLDVPGVDLPGVFALRNIADATAFRDRIAAGLKVVVIGAGFIGLEVAATAAKLGAAVTVVEIARPMGRAVSPILSDFYTEAHRVFGARLALGVGVEAIKGTDKAEAVVLTDGEVVPADLVLVGVGVIAEDALAREAGLECKNGVVVDAHLATSDPDISAIGDCAAFPNATLGFSTRLESIQNAVDQAKCRRGAARPASPRPTTRSPGSGATRAT